MAVLEDQQLVEQIFIFMTAVDLSVLASVSKAAYLYAHYGDLWRELVMDYHGGEWTYRESWKTTYIDQYIAKLPASSARLVVPHSPIIVKGFYSDLLYDEWQSSVVDLRIWADACPDNIDRRSGLSIEDFEREYGIPNKPVILTDVVPQWRAYTEWTKEKMIERFQGRTFQVGRVETTLDKYFKYCARSSDEKPLYLFDNLYGEKYPDLLLDYKVPKYFETDYFALLGVKDRPSYRWMLAGPARSGSTFHKDPNSTSAWNGLISGLKLWIMYPPEVPPPAVFPSKDEAEVTTPVSVTEWMLRFYHEMKRSDEVRSGRVKPIECLQRPGDLIFIPNGWWHQVLNIEECIAVTQNVVCDANLLNVVKFLKAKKRPDVWNAFSAAVREQHPGKLESIEQEIADSKRKFEIKTQLQTEEETKDIFKPATFSFLNRG